MTNPAAPDSPGAAPSSARNFYFATWRWHFYAGLYVTPFLITLAATGLIMLWVSATTELNGERTKVPVGETLVPVSTMITTAETAAGGTASQYIEPRAEGRVALVLVDSDDIQTAVTIDPYSGKPVDQFPAYEGWYSFASQIHGELLLGQWGDMAIEAAASLGIIMVLSGIYLHWPRDKSWRQTLLPRLTGRGRGWWKALHGAVGLWASVMLLVFLISGVSWAVIWGEKYVQAWSTFPAEKWDAVPLSDKKHAEMNHGVDKEVPWALEQTPMPESGSLAGTEAIVGKVDVDSIVAYARALGFNGRFQVTIPGDPEGVWTISHDSMSNDGPDPWGDRTIHIDQYTGKVLADVRFADYSIYGQAMAVGIAFHEGDLGNWNLLLNTIFCLGMIFLPVSGIVMWWKRRPSGQMRLGAPPEPRTPVWVGLSILVVALGITFPMGGLAILVAVLLDRLVLRVVPGLKKVFS
jgi:uncharacterized iron-regulated membrane protein